MSLSGGLIRPLGIYEPGPGVPEPPPGPFDDPNPNSLYRKFPPVNAAIDPTNVTIGRRGGERDRLRRRPNQEPVEG